MVRFGQIVLGPPGSGKTTYVASMSEFLRSLGRKVSVINLDPANESIGGSSKTPDVDISDLIQVNDVMSSLSLGPNGALIYAMEFLESNESWLNSALNSLDHDTYILIDCPGQVELFTHHTSLKNIIQRLGHNLRLAAVHLVDAHYCSDPGKYISVLLASLSTMLNMELPHVNVLSKVDLVEKYGKLRFNMEYYTEVLDLDYLLDSMDEDPFLKRYKKLNKAITDIVGSYGLVHFLPLSVQSKEAMLGVMSAVDKANGYCFGSQEERSLRSFMSTAMGGSDFEYSRSGIIGEKYCSSRDEPQIKKEKLGNDLDDIVEKDPEFQV
uniref:GPN-loop GTPase 2 n=1 Tax=Caligus rogercresseyi TaxID=217165 RepID=C1BMU7_CALRO|nr:ATP-binding domain 1 family member B [Caligus rogercresseyi]